MGNADPTIPVGGYWRAVREHWRFLPLLPRTLWGLVTGLIADRCPPLADWRPMCPCMSLLRDQYDRRRCPVRCGELKTALESYFDLDADGHVIRWWPNGKPWHPNTPAHFQTVSPWSLAQGADVPAQCWKDVPRGDL